MQHLPLEPVRTSRFPPRAEGDLFSVNGGGGVPVVSMPVNRTKKVKRQTGSVLLSRSTPDADPESQTKSQMNETKKTNLTF